MYIYDLNRPEHNLSVENKPIVLPGVDEKNLFVRNVERNSKIVAITNNNKVIMQLPRGNLETINHRILVLNAVKLHIQN